MKKKNMILWMESLNKVAQCLQESTAACQKQNLIDNELNKTLQQINDQLAENFPKILTKIDRFQELIATNNQLKQETNKKIQTLITEVQYANKKLEN